MGVPLLTIIAIGYLAWRYRKALGLDKTWDQHGRPHAQDLAAQLGWGKPRQQTATSRTSQRQTTHNEPRRGAFIDRIDSRKLPAALIAGAIVGVVEIGLEISGHSFLATVVVLAIGPFAGGLYVRSLWWVLVAAVLAVIVGAGGRAGSILVGLAVAAIAYGAIRTDARTWLDRWTSES